MGQQAVKAAVLALGRGETGIYPRKAAARRQQLPMAEALQEWGPVSCSKPPLESPPLGVVVAGTVLNVALHWSCNPRHPVEG